jgi:Xaa-Pro aminopeptidase
MSAKDNIRKLRKLMKESGLAGYVVPSTDPHQSEYVAEAWRRRAFLSGFDGSAGTCVVTLNKAGLWTDSRYFLQAEQQLAGTGIELQKIGEPGVLEFEDWLASTLKPTQVVGADPNVFSDEAYQRLEKTLRGNSIVLKAMEKQDLVEAIWGEARPELPKTPVRPHPVKYAGKSVQEKLEDICELMAVRNVQAYVISALDELAWLFNLRGSDVAFNPVFVAYAIVKKDKAILFLDLAKVTDEARDALPGAVALAPYGAFRSHLVALGKEGAAVMLDPATTNAKTVSTLLCAGAAIRREPGVIPPMKAAKNAAEIKGMRDCHVRDGIAMVKFFSWLEQALGGPRLTELVVADKLQSFRDDGKTFIGMSFGTIAAFGPHGAIVHYAPTPESNIPIKGDNLLLVDSGGQYCDGTTDITRTVAIGTPTKEQKVAYSLVLRGHLALGSTLFPEGTNGYQLDVIARSELWRGALNYGHGTGHGIGAALCVHEGPFSVSLRKNLTPLKLGYTLSNEPGYYKTGAFGVRIENLVRVVEKVRNDSGNFLGFEDLTLCPYDRRLILPALLGDEGRKLVNSYHAKVLARLSPHLEGDEKKWLARATKPI